METGHPPAPPLLWFRLPQAMGVSSPGSPGLEEKMLSKVVKIPHVSKKHSSQRKTRWLLKDHQTFGSEGERLKSRRGRQLPVPSAMEGFRRQTTAYIFS